MFVESHTALLTAEEWLAEELSWRDWAVSVGVGDVDSFLRCMASEKTSNRIAEDLRLAELVGASGTPTFVTRKGVFPGVRGFRDALESLGASQSRDGAPSDDANQTRSLSGPILFDSDRVEDAELSELGRLTRALFLDDGAVFVDRARVMFVDLNAEQIRKVSRRGEGPREILALLPSVSRVPEGLVVWDNRLRRASSFTQAGEFRRTMPLRSIERGQRFIGALDDSSFVFANGPPLDGMPEGRARHSREVRVVASNGTSRLVAVVPSREYNHVRDPPMYPLRLVPVIFGHTTHLSVSRGRIVVADTAEDSVLIYNRRGDVVARIPMPAWRREASDRQVAHVRDSLTADWDGRPELPHPFVKPPTPQYDARRGQLPPIDALKVDANGRIWIRAHLLPGDEKQRWTVWDDEQRTFSVEMSVREVLMDADGDRMLVRTENKLGVHRVTVRALGPLG